LPTTFRAVPTAPLALALDLPLLPLLELRVRCWL
jgi:hypothetical protein